MATGSHIEASLQIDTFSSRDPTWSLHNFHCPSSEWKMIVEEDKVRETGDDCNAFPFSIYKIVVKYVYGSKVHCNSVSLIMGLNSRLVEMSGNLRHDGFLQFDAFYPPSYYNGIAQDQRW